LSDNHNFLLVQTYFYVKTLVNMAGLVDIIVRQNTREHGRTC